MEGDANNTGDAEVTQSVDTRHGPHPHAFRRILIGVGAILCIVFGAILWTKWGATVQEACFGDGEICSVELPDTTEADTTTGE